MADVTQVSMQRSKTLQNNVHITVHASDRCHHTPKTVPTATPTSVEHAVRPEMVPYAKPTSENGHGGRQGEPIDLVKKID